MSTKWIAVPSRFGVSAWSAAVVLGLMAMAAPGCSDSSTTQNSNIPGTPPGESIAPGGAIKPNATPSKPAAKAEPL